MQDQDSKPPRQKIHYLWNVWLYMVGRCENEEFVSYKDYGARGIRIYESWHRFPVFKKDILSEIGDRPTSKHQFDRIDNNGDYQPGNVKWSTCLEQSRNRRSNIFATIENRTQCIADWVKELGLNRQAVYARIRLRGWTVEQALELDPKPNKKKLTGKLMTLDGKTNNLAGWARSIGVSSKVLATRLKNGLNLEEALSIRKKAPVSTYNRKRRRAGGAPRRLLMARGEALCATEWGKRVNLHPEVITSRIKRGWGVEQAIFTPPNGKPRHNLHSSKPLTFNGETKHLAAWARQVGITPCSFAKRLRLGWSLEKAITTKPQQVRSTKAA